MTVFRGWYGNTRRRQNVKDFSRRAAAGCSLLLGPLFLPLGGLVLYAALAMPIGSRDQGLKTLLIVAGSLMILISAYGVTFGIRDTPRLLRTVFWILFLLLGVWFANSDPLMLGLFRWVVSGVFWAWSLYICWWQDNRI